MSKTVIVQPSSSGDSGSGFLLAVVLLIIFGFIFWMWGLPLLRQTADEGVQINVPSQLDVNVNQPDSQAQ